MISEKTLLLQTGRAVKVITKGNSANDADKTKMPEIDVLIKEPKDQDFHPPIGLAHPKYWKLKSLDENSARLFQIKYSGLTRKHLRKLAAELVSTIS